MQEHSDFCIYPGEFMTKRQTQVGLLGACSGDWHEAAGLQLHEILHHILTPPNQKRQYFAATPILSVTYYRANLTSHRSMSLGVAEVIVFDSSAKPILRAPCGH